MTSPTPASAPAASAPKPPSPIMANGVSYTPLQVNPHDADSATFYAETQMLQLAAKFLMKGRPVVFLGESGSGKTELARALMRRLKVDEVFQMEFGGVISGDQLDGMYVLEGAETKFYPSEHLKAVREASAGKRIGYVPDEMNRASMFGINKLLRLYAQYEYVSDLDGVLTVEPQNLLTVGTMNIGFGFTGTNRVDAAIADRFAPLRLESPPTEILSRILYDRYDGIDKGAVTGICKIYKASRETEDSYRLGVRDALRLGAAVHEAGVSLVTGVEMLIGASAFLQGLPEEATEALITIAKSVGK